MPSCSYVHKQTVERLIKPSLYLIFCRQWRIEFHFFAHSPQIVEYFIWIGLLQRFNRCESHLLKNGDPYFRNADGYILFDRCDRRHFFWTHLWKEQHFLNRCVIREEHDQTIHPNPQTRCRWHSVL